MSLIQKAKNLLWHLPKSYFYNFKYGFPSQKLTLIGITGTDGKTTTATLVHSILTQAGFKAGLITTLGAQIGTESLDTGLHMTSPDSSLVQKILKKMVDAGMTHAVIEVTAHALDQYRYQGCHFSISAITNTSHEHLDDFHNMKHYIDVKSKLFHNSDLAILNKDDASYQQISKNLTTPFATYSIKNKSDYQAKDITLTGSKLSFNIGSQLITTDSLFEYQVYNILAAYGITKALNIDEKLLVKTVLHFPEVKGRREVVANDLGFNTIVDFAHTPAALESTLSSIKKNTKGKLIVIFGATGGRDQTKRPIMGQIATSLADITLITSDDTRNEKIENINTQIISGIDQKKSQLVENLSISPEEVVDILKKKTVFFNIPNRQDAFNLAIRLASPGDTIIACGKGHETTILHGNTEYPWSESEAFRTAFKMRQLV